MNDGTDDGKAMKISIKNSVMSPSKRRLPRKPRKRSTTTTNNNNNNGIQSSVNLHWWIAALWLLLVTPETSGFGIPSKPNFRILRHSPSSSSNPDHHGAAATAALLLSAGSMEDSDGAQARLEQVRAMYKRALASKKSTRLEDPGGTSQPLQVCQRIDPDEKSRLLRYQSVKLVACVAAHVGHVVHEEDWEPTGENSAAATRLHQIRLNRATTSVLADLKQAQQHGNDDDSLERSKVGPNHEKNQKELNKMQQLVDKSRGNPKQQNSFSKDGIPKKRIQPRNSAAKDTKVESRLSDIFQASAQGLGLEEDEKEASLARSVFPRATNPSRVQERGSQVAQAPLNSAAESTSPSLSSSNEAHSSIDNKLEEESRSSPFRKASTSATTGKTKEERQKESERALSKFFGSSGQSYVSPSSGPGTDSKLPKDTSVATTSSRLAPRVVPSSPETKSDPSTEKLVSRVSQMMLEAAAQSSSIRGPQVKHPPVPKGAVVASSRTSTRKPQQRMEQMAVRVSEIMLEAATRDSPNKYQEGLKEKAVAAAGGKSPSFEADQKMEKVADRVSEMMQGAATRSPVIEGGGTPPARPAVEPRVVAIPPTPEYDQKMEKVVACVSKMMQEKSTQSPPVQDEDSLQPKSAVVSRGTRISPLPESDQKMEKVVARVSKMMQEKSTQSPPVQDEDSLQPKSAVVSRGTRISPLPESDQKMEKVVARVSKMMQETAARSPSFETSVEGGNLTKPNPSVLSRGAGIVPPQDPDSDQKMEKVVARLSKMMQETAAKSPANQYEDSAALKLEIGPCGADTTPPLSPLNSPRDSNIEEAYSGTSTSPLDLYLIQERVLQIAQVQGKVPLSSAAESSSPSMFSSFNLEKAPIDKKQTQQVQPSSPKVSSKSYSSLPKEGPSQWDIVGRVSEMVEQAATVGGMSPPPPVSNAQKVVTEVIRADQERTTPEQKRQGPMTVGVVDRISDLLVERAGMSGKRFLSSSDEAAPSITNRGARQEKATASQVIPVPSATVTNSDPRTEKLIARVSQMMQETALQSSIPRGPSIQAKSPPIPKGTAVASSRKSSQNPEQGIEQMTARVSEIVQEATAQDSAVISQEGLKAKEIPATRGTSPSQSTLEEIDQKMEKVVARVSKMMQESATRSPPVQDEDSPQPKSAVVSRGAGISSLPKSDQKIEKVVECVSEMMQETATRASGTSSNTGRIIDVEDESEAATSYSQSAKTMINNTDLVVDRVSEMMKETASRSPENSRESPSLLSIPSTPQKTKLRDEMEMQLNDKSAPSSFLRKPATTSGIEEPQVTEKDQNKKAESSWSSPFLNPSTPRTSAGKTIEDKERESERALSKFFGSSGLNTVLSSSGSGADLNPPKDGGVGGHVESDEDPESSSFSSIDSTTTASTISLSAFQPIKNGEETGDNEDFSPPSNKKELQNPSSKSSLSSSTLGSTFSEKDNTTPSPFPSTKSESNGESKSQQSVVSSPPSSGSTAREKESTKSETPFASKAWKSFKGEKKTSLSSSSPFGSSNQPEPPFASTSQVGSMSSGESHFPGGSPSPFGSSAPMHEKSKSASSVSPKVPKDATGDSKPSFPSSFSSSLPPPSPVPSSQPEDSENENKASSTSSSRAAFPTSGSKSASPFSSFQPKESENTRHSFSASSSPFGSAFPASGSKS
eukprot:CAMPEP_0172471234 /NCGR_PEP_ID=MMETSP1065-20121228/67713_1 /TAXON_ID=265537 /ORGANISM="Amphiprora paludosa, Strain CCMP125" /LENGTH=1662 /DNA_ID=CAMNT_0013229329 /DNA_START=90 /DNA_END=5075 /DNA_ORIENTATION=+